MHLLVNGNPYGIRHSPGGRCCAHRKCPTRQRRWTLHRHAIGLIKQCIRDPCTCRDDSGGTCRSRGRTRREKRIKCNRRSGRHDISTVIAYRHLNSRRTTRRTYDVCRENREICIASRKYLRELTRHIQGVRAWDLWNRATRHCIGHRPAYCICRSGSVQCSGSPRAQTPVSLSSRKMSGLMSTKGSPQLDNNWCRGDP